MNHIYSKFKGLHFEQTGGYLEIDEMLIDWGNYTRHLPVKIMRKDYVIREKPERFDQTGDPKEFKSSGILLHKYHIGFNIFE